MGNVPQGFFQGVLTDIGAPITTDNLRTVHAWQLAEGGAAANNPWNTTEPEPGATWYNTFGPLGQYHVMNYPNENVGIAATVKTLENGRYATVIDAFRRGNDGYGVATAIDLSVWGTHDARRVYASLYGTGPAPAPAPPPARLLKLETPFMRGSDVRGVQEALIRHGYGVGSTGADGYYGPATVAAVKAFQGHVHLVVDGVVGPNTRHALGLR